MKKLSIVLICIFVLSGCKPAEVTENPAAETAAETATETVTPPASETTALPTESDGPLLYSDDFSDETSGWEAPDDSASKFFYFNGEYHIRVVQNASFYFMTSEETFDKGVFSVELRHVSGNDLTTGGMLIWNYRDNSNFLALSITDDGTFVVHRYLVGEYYQVSLPIQSAALYTFDESNKITIVFYNGISDIYINDQFVYSFTDDILSHGSVGLGAYPDVESGVEVAFDNLTVYRYDPQSLYTPVRPQSTATPQYRSITWQELVDFLTADHINWNQYDLETYNCMDFAIDLVENAAAQNIKAHIVGVDFVGQEFGHAFVVFDTSDRGEVFVEPQGDNTYSNVVIGNDLCDDWGQAACMGVIANIEYYGECDHQHNCTLLNP